MDDRMGWRITSPPAKTPACFVDPRSSVGIVSSLMPSFLGREERSAPSPTAVMTWSTSRVKFDPLISTGRRRPSSSGGPRRFFTHSNWVTLPFSVTTFTGDTRKETSIPLLFGFVNLGGKGRHLLARPR